MVMDKLEIIPIDLKNRKMAESWDAFVLDHPEGTVFHSTSWLKILEGAYGFKPCHFQRLAGQGEISAVLPGFIIRTGFGGTKFISLPFSDYGGVLAVNETVSSGILRTLVQGVGNGYRRIEIRSASGEGPEDFQKGKIYIRHLLRLSDQKEEVFERLEKRTIRYSIKKALKSNIIVSQENNLEGLNHFFLLNRKTRKKHGIPSQPRKFFRILFEEMISTGLASIYIARQGADPISAGVFLVHGHTSYYKYNASDPEALARKLTPNHLLTWQAIQDAIDCGMKSLDFGRTSMTNEGLRRYKEMWGAKESGIVYNFFPKAPRSVDEVSRSYALFTCLWKRMPDKFEETIGPWILKYFGSG